MVLFLKPVFKDRIWGGDALKSFNYDIPNHHTGECWAISAHANGPNTIINEPYQGESLEEVWTNHPELFNDNSNKSFPLLTKVLDANQKLSVQVHPDDNYALEHEGEYGKTECWYILEASEDAEIIYGVNAKTQEELHQMIDNKDFERLFNHIPVKPGEFYYVPAGTVHAIGENIMILETQQSSDTTYRIYDYNRRDNQGNLRELHLEQSKQVIDLSPHKVNAEPVTEIKDNQKVIQFVSNEFFSVYKWEIDGKLRYQKPHPYCLVTVIEGEGHVMINQQDHSITKGTSFILTTEDTEIQFDGTLHLIISHP